MANTELSIIIVSYNTKLITQHCINSVVTSLTNTSFSYEIIVIDNNSTDGSVEIVEELSKKNRHIRSIRNNTNAGFAKANNQAVSHAQGQTVLLLNSDCVVLDNAISDLYAFFTQNKHTYQFAGGKLFNKDMTPQPSCGPFYSLPVVFAALFLRGDYWGLTRSSPNETKQVDWVSGACIMTEKKIYEQLGGFDETIFMYMEEIDLLYRAKKQGLLTAFYPKARFIHLGSASSGKRTFPIVQVYKGFIFLYQKHLPGLPFLLLTGMLQLKALVALFIGHITRNAYLIQTYEEALSILKMDRPKHH